ncbi:hypothetical protein Atoyac15_29 [Aeromonas phage Atoyac15]|uniref:Uncharacterized protein n=1 Tax=Aeromonas phage Atoyac15 TaxID=2767551 RepID=A0A866D299_9CAUD|nr:hypothetical protein Atoyac15_29 [Aeromonas phage Atoyac15]
MSNTALVHPRTAHLPPDEQAVGTYVYTSPEELARLETLRRAEEQRLTGTNLPDVPTRHPVPEPKRLVRKPVADKADIYPAVLSLAMALDAHRQEQLFINLANQLGYTLE